MSYETITVGENEHRTIEVGRGETFENVLIDLGRTGSSATIKAIETGWTIRNVAFAGTQEDPEGPAMLLADRSKQTSVVDWVYMADGSDGGRGTGIEVAHSHNGMIRCSRVRAEDWGDRAFHSARPDMGGAGGSVRYTKCYGAGSWGANFQTGADSLSYCVSDEAGRYDGRCVWAWGDTIVTKSHLVTNGAHYAVQAGIPGNDARVTIKHSEYENSYDTGLYAHGSSEIEQVQTGTAPDATRPDTPDTPEAAAKGSSDPIIFNPRSSDNYETITAKGQRIRVDSNQTWENKLIDFGNKNTITIAAYGSDWTIRNVGFKGTIPEHDTIFGVAETGNGTATMENIYFGEATGDQPASRRSICIWVNPKHSGHLDVTNVNFNVPGNNGIYGSAPALTRSPYGGQGGTIAIDGCYANDNHHTAYRIGDNGSSIANSVSYKSGSRAASRSAWIWGGSQSGGATVTDCHFITNGMGQGLVLKDNPEVDLTRVYTDDGSGTHAGPDDFVPSGCPTTAKEAASGSGPSSPSPSDPNSGSGGSDQYPTDWTATPTQTMSATGSFDERIENLDTGGEYEYRAVVDTGDQIERGNNRQFIAEEGGGNTGSGGSDPISRNPTPGPDYPDNPGRSETVIVEVEPGDHWTPKIGDGETWENVIIDLTNKNTACTIMTTGGSWTIRNVAFAGSQDLTFSGPCYAITAQTESGGEGIIRNCWLGDGSHVGRKECGTYGRGGVYVTEDNRGTIRVEDSTIAWWPGAGVHAYHGDGNVHVDGCYMENCGYSYFAPGHVGDTMENCVVDHRLGGGA